MQFQKIKNGMSQTAAASELFISQSYLSQIETYDVRTPPELLTIMIKLYKCTTQELFP